MKFVHPKCLLHWMKQRITLECKVCKHKYSVYRVYAENTPTRQPLREFVGGISMKTCHVLHFCWRFCFSVSQQTLMAPLIAFWMWRLSLVRSLSKAKELLYGLVISNVLYMMWLCGFALTREDEEDAEDGAHVAIAPEPGNDNHIADEIGEDAGELQAIAGVRNGDNVAWGLKLLVAPLLRIFQTVMIIIFRFHVPLRMPGILSGHDYLVFSDYQWSADIGSILDRKNYSSCLSWLFFVAFSIFMPESALYIGNYSLKNASHAVTNLSNEIQNDSLLSCAIEVVAETLTENITGPGEASSSVGKPLSVYRRTVASKMSYYMREFLSTMIYPFFLIIHLGVLPLVYGWWLDVCTITMFGKSISSRVAFFSKFPLLSSSMHWAVGIIYMFQIHISTSLLQRVLRKEALYFLQGLADPDSIVLRVLTDDVHLQTSRLLFSIAVNGILIVFLVYLPVVLAMRLAPTTFPLHIPVSDPFTEIPIAMLLLKTWAHWWAGECESGKAAGRTD
ncbi:hypothetical protein MKX01_006141 [Papaver californicum]|nr:hypothetical protein MKX01_006141 [Papaver californicum]